MIRAKQLTYLLPTILLIFLLCQSIAAKNIRNPNEILKEIDAIAGDTMQQWCKAQHITYPPDAVLLRIFKKERELEIWAKNDGMPKMKLVQILPVCAMDYEPGPKMKEGDHKTPEGFYHPYFDYYSKYWWMWIDLEKVTKQGYAGNGSCFKMCIEYPNTLDKLRSQEAGFTKPGSGICMHGNCVSIGCVSLHNEDYLYLFAFSRHHNTTHYGKLQLHIFPFRFDKVTEWETEAKKFKHIDNFPMEKLIPFWQNLQKGFDMFNKKKDPLTIKVLKYTLDHNGKKIPAYKYSFQN